MSWKMVVLLGATIGSMAGFATYEGLMHIDKEIRSEFTYKAQTSNCELNNGMACDSLGTVQVPEEVLPIAEAAVVEEDVQPSTPPAPRPQPAVQETADTPPTTSPQPTASSRMREQAILQSKVSIEE